MRHVIAVVTECTQVRSYWYLVPESTGDDDLIVTRRMGTTIKLAIKDPIFETPDEFSPYRPNPDFKPDS